MNCTSMHTIHRTWLFIMTTVVLCLVIALFSGSLLFHQTIKKDATLVDFEDYLRQFIPHLMEKSSIPGCSISLVLNGEIAYSEAFGYADMESRRLLLPDTPMSVQSITKSVTAWGVLALVQEGLLDLDVPVTEYLRTWDFPKTRYSVENVTAGTLLNHSAAMPLGDFNDVYAPGEAMPSLRQTLTEQADMKGEPGKFSYSNVGYHVLELLIEEITTKQFSAYMHEKVLAPLGMHASFFEIPDSMKGCVPTGYDLQGRPVPVYLYPEKSSGGLFATAEDIARFAAASMKENPVLTAQQVRRLYKPEHTDIGVYSLVFDAYGLGHYLERLPNGMLSASHGGQGRGIMTHVQMVPETGDAIVILTNSQRSWPFIAHVLTQWARWRDFGTVGMTHILWAHYVMSGFIALLFSASMLLVLCAVLSPREEKRKGMGTAKALAALILIGILLWCKAQPYLLVSSVFPVLSKWLGWAVLCVSMSLLVSALLPIFTDRKLCSYP